MRELYEWRNKRKHEWNAKLSDSTCDQNTFEEYLSEFPTDEKVWLKYIAHAIDQKVSDNELEGIFQRVLGICDVSAEIWMAYINWKKNTDPTSLMNVFKGAILAAGRNWESGYLIEYILDNVPSEEHEIRSLIFETCVNRMYPHLKHKLPQNSHYLDIISNNRNIFDIKRRYESGHFLTRTKYMEYVTALESISIVEAACLHKRMVLTFSDFPDVWIRYCDFAVKHKTIDDPFGNILAKCCMQLAPWNYMMKYECLIYSDTEFRDHPGIPPIFESLVNTCWLDLEVIEWIIKSQPARACENLRQLTDRFLDTGDQEGMAYLRLMLFRETNDFSILETILESFASRDVERLAPVDLVPLCYSFARISNEGKTILNKTTLDKLLRFNHFQILELGIPKSFPELFPKDDQGRPPPPRAVGKAPPKPKDGEGFHRQQREMKRSLPGYTPGYLAEQYAKKHKL